jgi:predicted TPR repeat methyltransferase
MVPPMLNTLNFRQPVFKVDLSVLPDLPSTGYYLPTGYRAREQPEYYVDAPQVNRFGVRIYAQPDVYTTARNIAEKADATRIIDVGCGDGAKLVTFHPSFAITGLDFGSNIAQAKQRFPFGEWLEHDLSVSGLLPVDTTGAVVICADVIEHLVDPDLLLVRLREALNTAHAVVLSTPDRERWRGLSHIGPPVNRAHTREWTVAELARYLRSRGFTSGRVGYTRYRTWRPERKNIIAVLLPG